MSKITNVRLPNVGRMDYDPQQFNQLVRSLEQVILQLNSNYTPTTTEDQGDALRWFSAAPGAAGFTANTRGGQLASGNSAPFAMLMSNVDQANAGVTSENLLSFDLVPVSNGIYIENSTRIKVPAAGHYLVSFSLQVTNRGNTAAEFEVWAKDTGVNFPLSNTRFDIPQRKSSEVWSHIVPSVTGVFSVSNPATDYLEIAWWSDSTDVYIEHYPAGTNPTRPEIPSIILAIAFVSSSAIGGSPTANVAVTLPSVSGTASLGTASAGPAIFVPSGTVVGTGNVSSPTITGTSVAPVSGVGTFGYAGTAQSVVGENIAVSITGVEAQGQVVHDFLFTLPDGLLATAVSFPIFTTFASGSDRLILRKFIYKDPTNPSQIPVWIPEAGQIITFYRIGTPYLGGVVPSNSSGSVGGIDFSTGFAGVSFVIQEVTFETIDDKPVAAYRINTGQVATGAVTVNTGYYGILISL